MAVYPPQGSRKESDKQKKYLSLKKCCTYVCPSRAITIGCGQALLRKTRVVESARDLQGGSVQVNRRPGCFTMHSNALLRRATAMGGGLILAAIYLVARDEVRGSS